MSEDCQKCGTAMYELDEDRNCPGCSSDEECTTCEGTGYIDNPDYRTDRDSMALDCPDCDDEDYEPVDEEEDSFG